jgi:hypothetical protein
MNCTSTYYHPLLRRINRTNIKNKTFDFIKEIGLDLTQDKHEVEKRILCELFIIIVANKLIDDIENNISKIIQHWNEEMSFLRIKISYSFIKEIEEEKYKLLLLDVLNKSTIEQRKVLFNVYNLEMHIAEFVGVDFEEEIIYPPGLIITSERRPFFENLFPDDIKWKI